MCVTFRVCVVQRLCVCYCVYVQKLTDSMLPLLPLVKVLLRAGLLSLSTGSPAASPTGRTPALPIPVSQAAGPGGSLLATSSWVGYNSSPDGG